MTDWGSERLGSTMAKSLPNLLTAGRIAAIPLLVLLLFLDGGVARWAAFLIFVGAAVTDYFDGFAARRLKVVTPLGRFLDPIADKLLVAAVIVALVAVDKLTGLLVAAAILVLCRELPIKVVLLSRYHGSGDGLHLSQALLVRGSGRQLPLLCRLGLAAVLCGALHVSRLKSLVARLK